MADELPVYYRGGVGKSEKTRLDTIKLYFGTKWGAFICTAVSKGFWLYICVINPKVGLSGRLEEEGSLMTRRSDSRCEGRYRTPSRVDTDSLYLLDASPHRSTSQGRCHPPTATFHHPPSSPPLRWSHPRRACPPPHAALPPRATATVKVSERWQRADCMCERGCGVGTGLPLVKKDNFHCASIRTAL